MNKLDFVGPLALRLFLVPVFLSAGLHKWHNFEATAGWFESLGMPLPAVMAGLAIAAEIGGALALLAGFAVRLACIPLSVTMLVAIAVVHWEHGWFAIAPSNPDTNMAGLFAPLGFDAAQQSLAQSAEVGERVRRARDLLKENGNYRWLTEYGNYVVLNNGIEFAVTYLVMLLALLCGGAGRYVSVDYWLRRWWMQRSS